MKYRALWCLLLAACSKSTGGLFDEVECADGVTLDLRVEEPCEPRLLSMIDELEITDPRGSRKLPPSMPSAMLCVAAGTITARGTAGGQLRAYGERAVAAGATSVTIRLLPVDDFYIPGACGGLGVARYGLTVTPLSDDGSALIAGGANLAQDTLQYTRAVERFDAETERLELVGELRAGGARAFHTATAIGGGRVLIAGGEAHVALARQSLKSSLIIDGADPANVRVQDSAVLYQAKVHHTATRLADGRVLLAGGMIHNSGSPDPASQIYLPTIELWDPASGLSTASDTQLRPRAMHTATLLADGMHVIIAGGRDAAGPVRSIELFRIQGNEVVLLDEEMMLQAGPISHAATLLPTGAVALIGGAAEDPSNGVEVWTMQQGAFLQRECTDALLQARAEHTADQLGTRTLIAGGRGAMNTAEILSFDVSAARCFGEPPVMRTLRDERTQHASARLDARGRVMIAGGRKLDDPPFGTSIAGVEIFVPDPTKD